MGIRYVQRELEQQAGTGYLNPSTGAARGECYYLCMLRPALYPDLSIASVLDSPRGSRQCTAKKKSNCILYVPTTA